MKRRPAVDAVIVGAGWTGLAMAKQLATRTSWKVLVLERGPERKTADYIDDMDELDLAIRLRMMQDISEETITFRHTPRDRALPVRQYGSFLPGTGVGGTGEHWSGISWATHTPRIGRSRIGRGHSGWWGMLLGSMMGRRWHLSGGGRSISHVT